jgi:nucleotide-binding universal stress UspA family protein
VSFREIVVGVDFGASSLAAVRWVAHEFAPEARIHLVHVTPDPCSSSLLRPYVAEGVDPFRDVHDIYQALRGLSNTLGSDRTEVNILEGVPADGLAQAAEEVGADLICVGKSRQRRASGRFGATTPHRLLARAPLPVLTVPEATRGTPTALLAALSDGRESNHVLQTAARIATAHGAHLDVLHALEADVQEAAAAAQRLGCRTRLPTIAQNWLAAQVKRLPVDRPSTTTLAPCGDAGEEIVAHAARADVGLIVAGRYRDREPRPAVPSLGSCTRLLLWAAPSPVLVLGTVGVDRQPPARSRTPRRGARRPAPLSVVTGGDAA